MHFEQICKENSEQFEILKTLWIPYLREIYTDEETKNETDLQLANYARQRVNIQGNRQDMFFELLSYNKEYIGFAYYAIDLGGIKDLIDPGYGYIMEFYIKPTMRRKGLATQAFNHILGNFQKLNVKTLYLTPDSQNGIPFWHKMGFEDCGKIDPDNHMPIYTKII